MTSAAPPAKKKRRRWGRLVRNWLAGITGPAVVRLWVLSLRLRGIGDLSAVRRRVMGPRGGIYVFWHQRMLVLAGAFKSSGFRVLISEHGDGEMISRIIDGLGMQAVRGSSTRGGARACREILRGTTPQSLVAITPDGPRGPRHVFQDGAIYLASRTGLPIYPITVTTRRRWSLPTWDGFQIPVPFSRAIIRLGAPLAVPEGADRATIERLRQQAEASLRELTERTDREFDALYPSARLL